MSSPYPAFLVGDAFSLIQLSLKRVSQFCQSAHSLIDLFELSLEVGILGGDALLLSVQVTDGPGDILQFVLDFGDLSFELFVLSLQVSLLLGDVVNGGPDIISLGFELVLLLLEFYFVLAGYFNLLAELLDGVGLLLLHGLNSLLVLEVSLFDVASEFGQFRFATFVQLDLRRVGSTSLV